MNSQRPTQLISITSPLTEISILCPSKFRTPLSLILPLSDLIIDYSFLYPNYEHVLMNIQTTHVLRLLIDYYHSQTTYRLQLLSNYLQTTPILKLTWLLPLYDHSSIQNTPIPLQFWNYSQNIPILRLQTTPRLLSVYSYSQTITILKLIKLTPI